SSPSWTKSSPARGACAASLESNPTSSAISPAPTENHSASISSKMTISESSSHFLITKLASSAPCGRPSKNSTNCAKCPNPQKTNGQTNKPKISTGSMAATRTTNRKNISNGSNPTPKKWLATPK